MSNTWEETPISNTWEEKHINDWSCQELQDWIISIKLGSKNQKKVIECISDQGITGEDFNSIEDKTEIKDTFPDLLSLSANKIWVALKRIRKQPNNKNTSSKKKELQNDTNNWNCSVCTFTNSSMLKQCEMCDNPHNNQQTYTNNKYKSEPIKKKSPPQTWKSKHINNWSCQEVQHWIISIGLDTKNEKIIQQSIDAQGIEGVDFNSMDSASDICDSFEGINNNIGDKIYAELVKVRRNNKNANTQKQTHDNYEENNNDNNNYNYNDGCIRIYGGADAKKQAANLRIMLNWLMSEGAKFSKLYIKCYSNEHHSVHTTLRCFKDDSICFIPHNCIITEEMTLISEIGQQIKQSNITLHSGHSWFAVYLLQEREKGINSKWCNYIKILPKKHSTIPLFLDNNQRKELQGSLSLQKIDDRLAILTAEYDSICVAVPQFARFSLNDFIWARCIIITRIYGLIINNIKTSGMVPLADLFNPRKREKKESTWTYSQLNKGFLVKANCDIHPNEQLFEGYGKKCNSRFFVNYGFCMENNIDNEGLMRFELNRNDILYQEKAIYLGFGNGEIVSKTFQIPIQYRNPKVKETFSFLRILYASPNEFEIISNNAMFSDIPKNSIETEKKVLESISNAAMNGLSNFRTSLEYDNGLLENEYEYPKGSIKRNIILMRKGEKEVLNFYINLKNICFPLFDMTLIDLQWKLKLINGFEIQYVNDVVIPILQKNEKKK
eukprot:43323_1